MFEVSLERLDHALRVHGNTSLRGSEIEALEAAFYEGEPYARTLVVKTHAGEIEVVLRVDADVFDDEDDFLRDILGELAVLANATDPRISTSCGNRSRTSWCVSSSRLQKPKVSKTSRTTAT